MNTNPVQTVSVLELANILRAVRGAQPIAFSALVDARARKTNNPFGEVLKLSRVQAFTGFDYENSVNRQLDREGKDQLTFAAKERTWGTRITPCLVRNDKTGELYLVAKIERAARPVYLTRSAAGYLVPTAKELLAAFLPEHKAPTNQGTDKEITYRNYSLANLVSLSIGGAKYRIRRHGSPLAVA